jgi:hypothetical protein
MTRAPHGRRQEGAELHKFPSGDTFALQTLIKRLFLFHLHLLNPIKNNSNTSPTLFKKGFASDALTNRCSQLFSSFARQEGHAAFAKPKNPSF